MMYGQMTAGSWIYIGTQGILQGTYETFAAGRPDQHFGGRPRRAARPHRRASAAWAAPSRWPPPWPAPPSWASRSTRAASRSASRPGYLDEAADIARRGAGAARRGAGGSDGRSRSACCGNAADVFPELVRRGVVPDLVTDQTTRPRPAERLRPARAGRWPRRAALRSERPGRATSGASRASHGGRRCGPCSSCSERGAPRLRLRQQPPRAGARRRASPTPSTSRASCPAYIRPLFCEGKGPVPLGGALRRPRGHRRHRRRACWRALPGERAPAPLDRPGRASASHFQGLPARICWLGYGERDRLGLAFNELVPHGRGQGARSSSAATTSTAARSPRPTARPRRCTTAPTRSPTGRS